MGGLVLTIGALGAGGFGWWWLSGILCAAALVPVARWGPRGLLAQFGAILPVFLIVTLLCCWSEAYIFMPAFRKYVGPGLMVPVLMYAIFAMVLAALAMILKLRQAEGPGVELRPGGKTAGLILVCGLAYAFYYLVFGGIAYQYFTKMYGPDAPAQVAKLGIWFWPIEIARGVLMTLAVLPAIRTLRMSRRQMAIAVGVLLWVTGGLAPLVLPTVAMGLRQRFIHTVEIFTQSASLGFTAGMLLRTKKTRNASAVAEIPIAA
jgi:hypothetical protein